MKLKQFLKPDWRKIAIMIIVVLLFLFIYLFIPGRPCFPDNCSLFYCPGTAFLENHICDSSRGVCFCGHIDIP